MRELDGAKYISLTTFTSDGRRKSTPVWVTGTGGSYAFTTGAESWKVRRIRRTPAVEVRVSDMRGNVAAGATTYAGTATVTDDPADVAAVKKAVDKKYGVQAKLIGVAGKARQLVGRGRGDNDIVAVHLTITGPVG